MTNPIKLTLGQAAREAGISKPSLSAAIKKGRVSAEKNESGVYEIDPAELFRVYPPPSQTNGLDRRKYGSASNPQANASKLPEDMMLDLLLAERDKLIEEKDKAIFRLEREKEEIRADLEEQRAQARRITLLLEHKLENKVTEGAGEWQKAFEALEKRIANGEDKAQRELDEVKRNAARQVLRYKKAYEEEKQKPFWQKLFG